MTTTTTTTTTTTNYEVIERAPWGEVVLWTGASKRTAERVARTHGGSVRVASAARSEAR